jgi:hypothetical protein
MAYLLLLGLIFIVGFIFLIFPTKKSPQRNANISFVIGLGFLGLGLLTEMVLSFHLNADSARLFYWSREMLALAWLGHGVLLLLFGSPKKTQGLTVALVFASALSLILIGATQVTKAEDWFRPAFPIFTQIGELLATNRPTRWGSWLLNTYGALALVGGAIYFLISRKKNTFSSLGALLLPIGAFAYLAPFIWPPQTENPLIYIVEFGVPVLLYLGYSTLLVSLSTRKVKRSPK